MVVHSMESMDGMEIVDLEPATQQLADLVAQVKDDELANPTPCPAYTLGDLIDHVGGVALAFAAAAHKQAGGYTEGAPFGDASRLPGDWRTQIPLDLATLALAWRDPAAWTGMTRIAGMDAPAAMVGLTVADELVVHGWDVARATGQLYHAEPELLGAAQAFLVQIASPDAPAGPDVPFGPPRLVPDDAPLLDRVVGLAGRNPGWPSG
jgi:uncharacterized protein (TIGR03086 family)